MGIAFGWFVPKMRITIWFPSQFRKLKFKFFKKIRKLKQERKPRPPAGDPMAGRPLTRADCPVAGNLGRHRLANSRQSTSGRCPFFFFFKNFLFFHFRTEKLMSETSDLKNLNRKFQNKQIKLMVSKNQIYGRRRWPLNFRF